MKLNFSCFFKAAEERADQLRQQQKDEQKSGNLFTQSPNNENNTSIISNESFNMFGPTASPLGMLNSTTTTTTTNSATPNSTTNILSPSISSYLQQQATANDHNSAPSVHVTPLTSQLNKILKKSKKDTEKKMLLSDDEF
jgi:hypothetical protein